MKVHRRLLPGVLFVLLGTGLVAFTPAPAGAVVPAAPIAPSSPVIPATVFSAASFGAVPGDGLSDSSALQAAFDAASAAGGGVVQLASGRYDLTIDPSTGIAVLLRSGVRLAGVSESATTLRLADAQGNYKAIFGQTLPAQRADDIAMQSFTLDGNTAGNPLAPATLATGARIAVLLWAGHRSRFSDVTFVDQESYQVLAASGSAVTDVAVVSCVFKDIGGEVIGGSIADHDHSSVYTFATRVLVSGNSFASRSGAGTRGARAAIETHGDDQAVIGNVVNGYMRGLNVTGVAVHSNRQLVSQNTMVHVAMGMYIWSKTTHTPLPAPALADLEIRDNDISLDVDPWLATNKTLVQGIATHFDNDSPIERLKITGNDIVFANAAVATASSTWDFDSYAAGISLGSRTGVAEIRDANISYNHVTDSLSAGIWSEVRFSGSTSVITNNVVTNPGRRLHASSSYAAGYPPFIDAYRSGVYLGEAGQTTSSAQVNNNSVVHDGSGPALHAAVTTQTRCTATCTVRGNTITGSSAPVLDLGPGWISLP